MLHISRGFEPVHEFGPAADGRERQAPAQGLADGADIRRHPKILLSPSRTFLERGLDLVEEEQHVVLLGEFAQMLQISGPGQDAAAIEVHWLQDHRAHLVAILRHGLLGGLRVVEGHGDNELAHRLGDAGRFPEKARLFQLLAGRVAADVGVLVVPVEMTGEADDLVPPRNGPAQPQGVERGLGARIGEAHPLGTGNQPAESLGQLDVVGHISGTAHPQLGGPDQGLTHRRMSVAQQGGPVAARHVQVLAAVHVGEMRSLGALHVHRMAQPLVQSGRGTHPTRQYLLAPREQRCVFHSAPFVISPAPCCAEFGQWGRHLFSHPPLEFLLVLPEDFLVDLLAHEPGHSE